MKPIKTIISRSELAALRGHIFQEKLDGRFALREVGRSLIAGEQMNGGRFIAFDCLTFEGQDIRNAPLESRLDCLSRFDFPQPLTSADGQGLLSRVWESGGEGIVCKASGSPYGQMLAIKRTIELLCAVSQISDTSQAVKICDAKTGEDRGNVALFGGKIERVRVGSIIKVVGLCLTSRGLIREPRLCQDSPDSWLKQF